MKRKIIALAIVVISLSVVVIGCKTKKIVPKGDLISTETTSEKITAPNTDETTETIEETTSNNCEQSTENEINESAESVTEEQSQKPVETSTERPTQKPTENPTERPTQNPTENPTERPTQKPTESPTQKPTEKPTQKPTEAPVTSTKFVIGDVSLSIGETGYSTMPVSIVSNGKETIYTNYLTIYYAKNPADAERYFNEYVKAFENGKYNKYSTLTIYCEENVSYLDNILNEYTNIEEKYGNDSLYSKLKKRAFERDYIKMNADLSEFNCEKVMVYKSNAVYNIIFNFRMEDVEYKKCINKAKEYATSVQGTNHYEKIYNLCMKFKNVSYGVSENCEAAYSAFFGNKTLDEGITRAIAMCLKYMGYEYRIDYFTFGENLYVPSIMVKLDNKFYYLDTYEALDGAVNLTDFLLVGKDIMENYYITKTNKSTNEVRNIKITVSSGLYHNVMDETQCTCPGIISDTSYDQQAIIKGVLLKFSSYEPEKYTYSIVPMEK